MASRSLAVGLTLLLVSASFASARQLTQTDDQANNVGTAAAVSNSTKLTIPSMGCATYAFPNAYANFNYTAKLGLAKLPAGCDEKLIRILKQYTFGACPDTRANNYKVKALKITDECTDPILAADTKTCANAFEKAPPSAYAPEGIGASSTVDTGSVCWKTPQVFYFINNRCTLPITAVIKWTKDVYQGDCKSENDSDDGGDDAGGVGSTTAASGKPSGGGGGSGLSTGAKVGIAIGVIGGVLLIAGLVWFCCCQLGKN